MVRVGINGFGRIGRQSLKAILERTPDVEVESKDDDQVPLAFRSVAKRSKVLDSSSSASPMLPLVLQPTPLSMAPPADTMKPGVS